MSIQISFDFENMVPIVGEPVKELSLFADEENLLKIVIGFLADSVDISMVGVEKRSNDYTSLIYGGLNDFLRFKYSPRTKWISLRLPAAIQKENMENTLFAAQKNKKQLHWKSSLSSLSDLEALKPYIIASCVP